MHDPGHIRASSLSAEARNARSSGLFRANLEAVIHPVNIIDCGILINI